MKTFLTGAAVLSVLYLFSCSTNQPSQNDGVIKAVKQYGQDPKLYVIDKFKNHQVIFIGENHFIKEQVLFVRDLIPDLYKNGIYNLGTEFIRYSDTEVMNRLITDSIYDEELAKEITLRSAWQWGYKEYLDIYRAAWELNRQLPQDAPRFRIFGIEDDIDFSYVNSEEDFGNREIMQKVFPSLQEFKEEEGYSANAIQREVLDRNQKAMVHCGIHH